MEPSGESRKVEEAERAVLRALCQETIAQPLREEALRSLAQYRFRDPVNQVVFDVLREIGQALRPSASGQARAERLRELLPRLVTNKGFPDVDVQEYFTPQPCNDEEIGDRIRWLLVPPRGTRNA